MRKCLIVPIASFLLAFSLSTLAYKSKDPPKIARGQKLYTSCGVFSDQSKRRFYSCKHCLGHHDDCKKLCHWDFSQCRAEGYRDGKRIILRRSTGRSLRAARKNAIERCEDFAQDCEAIDCEKVFRHQSVKACGV